jgi:hypothetical protein
MLIGIRRDPLAARARPQLRLQENCLSSRLSPTELFAVHNERISELAVQRAGGAGKADHRLLVNEDGVDANRVPAAIDGVDDRLAKLLTSKNRRNKIGLALRSSSAAKRG